jgi:hypothetical protein
MKYVVNMGHDIHTKFHKDWFRHSKFLWWGGIQRQLSDLISPTFIFSKQGKHAKKTLNTASSGGRLK